MSSNKQDILKMGNMLLEGWTMLSEGCPICATAVMSKNGNMRCPKCDLPIISESNLDVTQKVFTENPVKPSSSSVSRTATDENATAAPPLPNSTFKSLEEAKREYDKKNRREQDNVSGLIGQYMLKGWTLLGAQCPKCVSTPLMSQQGGSRYCVLCKEQVHEHEPDDEAQEKPLPPTISDRFDMSQIPMLDPDMSGKLEGEGQSGQNQERVSGKIEEKDMLNCPVTLNKTDTDFVEKWSQQISSKLLQGWMLLDEVCVRSAGGCRGDLPLVKDLAGQKFCVKCGYQNEPPTAPFEATESGGGGDDMDCEGDGFEDDDDELDDAMAIKIQMMTNKSFIGMDNAKISSPNCSPLAPTSTVASATGVKYTPLSSESQTSVNETCSHDDHDLKNIMFAHIDKKLKSSASRLSSAASCAAEATEWAHLITALAGARRAVKEM